MGSSLALLVLVVLLALAFDYINGFHDTANAVATVVSTGVLPGRTAVLMAAAFNFIGAFAGVGVAKTIAEGIVADPAAIPQSVVVAALVAAILWNLLTWYFGIPSSSSHALIGAGATAMALGTASGGWRIMKTMGHRIIRLRPINGFAAETAAAAVILTASYLKTPVSTTHVISSSIMGVGASRHVSAVRWGVARRMLIAWVLTIPVTAAISALVYIGLRSIQ